MAHMDYTTVTDRIAARLVRVTTLRATAADLRLDRAGRIRTDGILAMAARIAQQSAQQGLSPEDLDQNEGGTDALYAIAAATHIPSKVHVPWEQLCLSLPDDWKHVVNAAGRQLARAATQLR